MPQTARSIFVVDDEAVISSTLAVILNQSGFQATAFTDPSEAMKAARENAPDLLISDVVMPGMTGVELALRFREAYPQCRVLLFSGQSVTADLLGKARQDGYDFDLLAKPVHPTELLARLRE